MLQATAYSRPPSSSPEVGSCCFAVWPPTRRLSTHWTTSMTTYTRTSSSLYRLHFLLSTHIHIHLYTDCSWRRWHTTQTFFSTLRHCIPQLLEELTVGSSQRLFFSFPLFPFLFLPLLPTFPFLLFLPSLCFSSHPVSISVSHFISLLLFSQGLSHARQVLYHLVTPQFLVF